MQHSTSTYYYTAVERRVVNGRASNMLLAEKKIDRQLINWLLRHVKTCFRRLFAYHRATVAVFTARCYAERCYAIVRRLSVCLTFWYVFRTGWNTSKIISRLISLSHLLGLTPTWAIWSNGNTPKIRVGLRGRGGYEHKNLQYIRNGAR